MCPKNCVMKLRHAPVASTRYDESMDDIYIFGDIGGHFDPFMTALEKLGVDTFMACVPVGTTIIQVGDLVHRGPKSDALVKFVDAALKNNEREDCGRWIQLLGNHEGHHIGGPKFSQTVKGQHVDWELGPEAEGTLKKWWGSDMAQMAVAVRRTDTDLPREMLVTHAGLAFQTWAGIGFPQGARSTALSLNSQNVKLSFAPGWLLGGYMKSSSGTMQPPGVAWASAAKEVYPSLLERSLGFDQVHGHSTLYNWFSQEWYCDSDISLGIDRWGSKRFTRWTNKAGEKLYGIDQGLGQSEPRFDIVPLHVVGEVLEP